MPTARLLLLVNYRPEYRHEWGSKTYYRQLHIDPLPADSAEVLMVGFMNDAAWKITLDSGYVTFFSRTRNTLWTKGETSGNRLAVRQIFTDCDDDTVLVKVDREGDGNVCHTGQRSCFYTEVTR